MGKFEGVLLCTDLDGTILRDDKSISAENLQAIEYFKAEGGLFTIVTGRMPFAATEIVDTVKPNIPFGCINGGGVFDPWKGDYIWTSQMADGVNELIAAVDREVPEAGIQVNTFYHTYFSKENDTMRIFREIQNLPNLVRHYTAVDEPVAKIVFSSEKEEQIQQIAKVLHTHPRSSEFNFIRSERSLYEILPKGIGKGAAIENLVRHLGLDPNKTIAMGDYNNDISMFHAAKIGVAVSNACPDALAAADYITVSNQQHAVAQIIDDLQTGKLML